MMTQNKNIIFALATISMMVSGVYSISWSSILPNRPLYYGEYVHFMWESSALDSCRDITISMLNATNSTVDSFTWERQPGFTKKIWKCGPSGQYRFKIDCGQYSDVSKLYSMSSVENNLIFYRRSADLISWIEQVAWINEKNISIFSYPDLTLLATKKVSRESADVIENTQIKYLIESRKNYKIKAYDMCNAVIGESQVFSTEFPLEPERVVPTNGPTGPNPTTAPTSGPTGPTPAPSPRPGPEQPTGSATKTTLSFTALLGLLIFL